MSWRTPVVLIAALNDPSVFVERELMPGDLALPRAVLLTGDREIQGRRLCERDVAVLESDNELVGRRLCIEHAFAHQVIGGIVRLDLLRRSIFAVVNDPARLFVFGIGD